MKNPIHSLLKLKTTLVQVSVFALMLVCSFAWAPKAFAAFSLSGAVITQTGTDTNLAGLSAIAGVTTTDTGEKNIYNIGSRRIIVNGNLSWSSINEVLITSGNNTANQIDINGTLTINGQKTVNGVTIDSYESGFISSATNLTACCTNGVWTIRSGGTFNLIGASMEVGSVMAHLAGSSFNVTNGRIVSRRDLAGNSVRLRQTGSIDINGLITEGISLDLFVVPTTLTNFEPKIVEGLHGIELISTPNATLRNFNPSGSNVDLDNWNNALLFLKNAVKGTDMVITNSNGGGKTAISKEVDVKFQDLAHSPISGVKVYVVDTDNGSRAAVAGLPGGVNATNNIVYQFTSTGTGQTGTQEIYTGFSRGGHVTANPTGQTLDRRGNSNSAGEDIFTFSAGSYNHLLSQTDYVLKGAGVLEPTWILFKDNNVSQLDKTVTDAYTSIGTLDQLYDRAKSWKVDNFGLVYPAIDQLLVSGNGAVLDLGNRNLVIDATATQAFAVDTGTNTITVKSALLAGGTIFTSFTTSGLVTYQNGAVQDTDYTDNTGFHPVDGTSPSISITSQVPTKIDKQGITVNIQATDNRAITVADVQVSLANTTAGVANLLCNQTSSVQVDCTLQVLSSGNIEIRAEDVRGLSTTELDLNYIIDTEAPNITATLNTSAPYTTQTPEVVFSATDNVSAAGNIDFTVSVDDGPFVTQSSPYTPTLVGDRHIIVIRAADELGNTGEFSFVYTPLLTITAPTTTANNDITDTTITASSINNLTDVTISGAGSTFVCTPDPTPAVPSGGPVTCSGSITNTGTLTISATDTLITDTTSLAYTIERTPPVITITAPTLSGTDGITDTTIRITDDVAVNAQDVFIDGSSSSAARLFNCTQTSVTQVDCTIDIASSGNLVILARDRSGNESMENQAYTVIPAGFSPSSSSGGSGGGSNSLLVCTTDPQAVNYYGGNLDGFKFYNIVNKCMYGDVIKGQVADNPQVPVVNVSTKTPQCFINYSRLIKRGMRGSDVKQAQQCISSLGHPTGPFDGIYGGLTLAGVRSYQKANNLLLDGIIGPQTAGHLNTLSGVKLDGVTSLN